MHSLVLTATLVVAFAFQPLLAGLCASRCGPDEARQAETSRPEHCQEGHAAPQEDDKGTHPAGEGSDCKHPHRLCAEPGTSRAEPNPPANPLLGIVLQPASVPVWSTGARAAVTPQQTSPPGLSLHAIPLRI